MRRLRRVELLTLFAVLVALGGCASAPLGSTVIKRLHEFDQGVPFKNVLVISVAGDYPTRVRFEQQLVAAFSTERPIATAFYTVVGRQAQLSRRVLNTVMSAREFDAIILTRVKGQDRADLVRNRPTGHGFELFLYDYEELNIPAHLNIGSTVSFVVEVYDARARKKIWAIESLLFDTRSVDSAISEQVAAIAAEIINDGLVRP